MKLIIIFITLFLVPLIGFASFPVDNETTEIINKVSNVNLDTKTPWYNTWWAILLNVFFLFIHPFLTMLGIFSFIRFFKRKIRNLIYIILGIVSAVLFVIVIWALSDLK